MPSHSRILTKATVATAISLGLLAIASTAQAKVITFGFSGQLLGDAADGSAFDAPIDYTGRYSFDDDAPNFSLRPGVGNYGGNSFELDFGTTHFETSTFLFSVANDLTLFGPPMDSYVIDAFVGQGVISLGIFYGSSNIFADDSLPLTAPPLTDTLAGFAPFLSLQDLFPTHSLVIGSLRNLTCLSCGDGGGTATPVPEPEAWSLAAIAGVPLLAFALARRRRGIG
jgi:hypothetical protein